MFCDMIILCQKMMLHRWEGRNLTCEGGNSLMLTDGRKTIGVFMNKADTNFQTTVQRITRQRAQELGYDVFYFITVSYRESMNVYDEQEKIMFDFVPVEKLDGALVTPDAYDMPGFRESLFRMLDERAKFPVVCVRDHENHYDCCFTDEATAIRPLMRHLLDDHGFRKVCFQAGYKEHPDSQARLECYLDEMEKHGIPLPPNAIHYGTMWSTGAEKAYQLFYGDPANWPEAVVCANDFMAQALIEQLQAHGYSVPQDTVVTGFDDIESSKRFVPGLTTVGQDYQTMVAKAVDLLHRRILDREQGIEVADRQRLGIPGKLILRESCGCGKRPGLEQITQELATLNKANQVGGIRVVSNTYFSIELNAAPTYEDIHHTIFRKLEDTPTIRDFYLCLFRKDGDYANTISPQVQLISAIQDRQDKGSPMICFDKDTLLPAMAERPGEAQVFYIYLLHQRDCTYGYTAIQYLDGGTPSLFYQHWNVIVSLALRNLDDQIRLRALYEERRRSSITDALTGLNNRRGLDELLIPQWEELCRSQETVCFASLDSDNLKTINDTLGHQGGDEALCTIADAIRSAVPQGGIPARIGGDEYLVFIPHCDLDGALTFRQKLNDFLAEKNKHMSFAVSVSVGVRVMTLREGADISRCVRESDEAMYAEKVRRHAELTRHARTLRCQ